MARYILIRVLGLIAVLLIVSVITFVLMHEVPGGPWQYGERPFTDQQLAALKKLYGLDKPLIEQYFSWLRGVLRLDFGRSFQCPDRSVTTLIRDTWPTTLHLGLMTIVVAFGLGLPLGIVAALKQNTWIDYLTTLLSVLGYVTPHFVWAILFILVFSLTFEIVSDRRLGQSPELGDARDGVCVGADGGDRALTRLQRAGCCAAGLRAHRAPRGCGKTQWSCGT